MLSGGLCLKKQYMYVLHYINFFPSVKNMKPTIYIYLWNKTLNCKSMKAAKSPQDYSFN